MPISASGLVLVFMVGEEAAEVHVFLAVFIFPKADPCDQLLVLAFRFFHVGIVNAAEVNDVENASAHDEKRFVIVNALFGADIHDMASAVFKIKLHTADQNAFIVGGVSKTVLTVGNRAEGHDPLLLAFGLNGDDS